MKRKRTHNWRTGFISSNIARMLVQKILSQNLLTFKTQT